MKSPHFISVAVALLLSFVQPSAQAVSAIPNEVEFITLYTQPGKGNVLYPYVIRFGDETGASIQKKQAKKVFKRLKKTPVDSIQFEGFELPLPNTPLLLSSVMASMTTETGIHLSTTSNGKSK